MGKIIEYEHHGQIVKVDEDLKGKHRDHCLCHRCEKFVPEDRGKNCQIANRLFQICRDFNLVTPVYECKVFEEKK